MKYFYSQLTAVFSGSEGWLDIEAFGREKINYLQHFLKPYGNGTPSDDTLRRFFRNINPKAFQAFDGDQNHYVFVSAFASEARLVLGPRESFR